jgi:hypothetical protein
MNNDEQSIPWYLNSWRSCFRIMALFLTGLLVTGNYGMANNLQVTNIRTGRYDYSNSTAEIVFDVSWENSWRMAGPPGNWDAVWLFIKFRRNGGSWQHAKLLNVGHSAPGGMVVSLGLVNSGSAFDVNTNPAVGVFLYRGGDGTSNLSLTDVSLVWNWGSNGVFSGDSIDVAVFGIEMVYVPQGAFYAGDNNATATGGFRQGVTDNDPWYISSEGALPVTSPAGNGPGAGQTASLHYYVAGLGGGGGMLREVYLLFQQRFRRVLADFT